MVMLYPTKHILLISFFSFISSGAFCMQDTTVKTNTLHDSTIKGNNYDSYRLALGAGGNWSLPNVEGPLAGGIILTYQHNFHLFSVRYIASVGVGGEQQPDESVYDIGILYGIGYHDSTVLIGVSTGIEYVDKWWPQYYKFQIVNTTINNYTIHTHTIGLPYQLQVLLTFTRNFGIGAIVFGDVNQIFSHIGGYFCLQFGVL